VAKRTFIGISCLCFLLVSFQQSCHKSGPADIVEPPPQTESFGTFLVQINGDIMDDPKITTVKGVINDGPVPPIMVFEKSDSTGPCALYKTRIPFCDPPCGSNAACVEDDSCQPYPQVVDAGLVTVNGMKIANAKTPFTMEYIAGNYQSPTLDMPPCAEGDTVTFAIEGKGSIPACTLTTKAIKPLKVLTDTFPCVDGQPLEVRWEPPDVPGISSIYVLIDISYHGTTKGKIECNCEDNGSLTVAASLLDKLKTYGISGFPKIEIYRRSTSVSAAAKVKVVFESKVVRFLSIPGIISCNGDAQCPPGQHCGADQRCH
jgi:hypothetical protein